MAEKAKNVKVSEAEHELALDAVSKAISDDAAQDEFDDIEESLRKASENLLDVDEPLDGSDRVETEYDDNLPATPPEAANSEYSNELNNLLYAIQQPIRSRAFLWASLLSIVWAGLCATYFYFNIFPKFSFGAQLPNGFQFTGSSTELVLFGVVLLMPVLLVWAYAGMVHRSRELRQAASNITQVSLRLLQPEKVAGDQIATVGSAIRREMNAIGDGVERAVARAGELEFMVQKEVMQLERAYGDSEVRMQRLMSDIGSERDAVVSHVEQLREAISRSQKDLQSDIGETATQIEDSIRQAGDTTLKNLEDQGTSLTSKMTQTGENLVEMLTRTNSEISSELESGRDKLGNDLSQNIQDFQSLISTSGEALATLLTSRTAAFEEVSDTLTSKLITGKKAFDITFAERAKELESILLDVGNSVSSSIKSNTSELAEHGNKLVLDLDEQQQKLLSSMSAKTKSFTSAANQAADRVEGVTDRASERLFENTDKVARQMEDTLSMRVADFEANFTRTTDTIGESIENNLQSIENKLDMSGNTLVSTLSASGENLVAALGMRTEALGKLLQERSGSIEKVISDQLSGFGNALTGHVQNAVEEMSSQSDALIKTSKGVEQIVGARTKQIEDLIKNSTITFAKGLEDNIKATDEKSKAIDAALDKAAVKFDASVNSGIKRMAGITKSTEDRIAARVHEDVNKLAETSKSMDTALNAASAKLNASVESGVKNVAAISRLTEEKLSAQIASDVEKLAKAAQSSEQKLAGQVTKDINRLIDTTKATEKAMSAQVTKDIEKLVNTTKVAEDQIVARLGKAGESAGLAISSISGNINENLKTSVSALATVLRAGNGDITKASEDIVKSIAVERDKVSKALAGETDKVSKALAVEGKKMSDNLSTYTGAFEKALAGQQEKLAQTLGEKTNELANSIASESKTLSETLEAGTSAFDAAISEKSNSLNSRINQGVHRVTSAFEAKAKEAGDRMEAGVNALEARLNETNGSVEKQFAAGTLVLNSKLKEGRDALLESITETVREAGETIDGKTGEFAEKLAAGQEAIASTMEEKLEKTGVAIDAKSEKISALLNERAELIQNSLGQNLVATQRQLEAKTEELNTLLSSRTSELSQIIESDAKPLVSSIENAGQSVRDQLIDTIEAVDKQTEEVFSKLSVSNEYLTELLERAGSNLDFLQGVITEKTTHFADVVETSQDAFESSVENAKSTLQSISDRSRNAFESAVSRSRENLEQANEMAEGIEGRLQATSSELVSNMQEISGRFDMQTGLLQNAVSLIDQAQSGIETTIAEKQDILAEISSGLVNRTEQINASLGSFARSVTGTLEELQKSASVTGSSLASELASAIDDATSRFGDSVDAMRNAAATVRSELGETRDEMRRGVLELPEETAQNASAMRRVVTDQIAALKDLSSIVERSGRLLDSRVATPRPAAAAKQPEMASAAAAPLQSPEPPAPLASRPAPARAQPVAPSRQAVKFPPDTVEAPVRPTATSPVAPQPAHTRQQDNNSGWVSDLLKRASTPEATRPAPAPRPDPRSPDQFVESLNSLSMDIASAIDHDASVELWERYQKGETNVFTRRLYTLQGQQTFDEIRRKYRSETEFRDAVNRYIDDFERLLADVSGKDTTGTMAQRYLTSDTGKVYTMLAHAGGRFDKM